MKRWKIVVLGGGALGIAYVVWKSQLAHAGDLPPFPTDEWGNPEGSDYDRWGRPHPPRPTGFGEEGVALTAQQAALYLIGEEQDDLTVPSVAGGLRFATNGILLDSRMRLCGKLQYPLKAKDTLLSVANRPDGMASWSKDSYYRIEVEGEPLLVRCHGKLASRRGMTMQILERTLMSNGRDPRAESWRTPQRAMISGFSIPRWRIRPMVDRGFSRWSENRPGSKGWGSCPVATRSGLTRSATIVSTRVMMDWGIIECGMRDWASAEP